MRKSDGVVTKRKHVRCRTCRCTGDDGDHATFATVRMRRLDELTDMFRVEWISTQAVDVYRNRV